MRLNYFNVYNIASFVDFHVGGQLDDTIRSEVSSEQVSCTTSVTVCINHFLEFILPSRL